MGIDKLTAWAAAVILAAAGTGQLPRLIHAVRVAQLELIHQSKASKWPKAHLLPISR